MPDHDTDDLAELKDKVDRLEDRVERQSNKNQLELKAYDLQVKAQSEEASLYEIARVCSQEMNQLTERALVGEYQELEEQNLFLQLFED